MPAWLSSLLLHLGILAGLTLIVATEQHEQLRLILLSDAQPYEDPLAESQEFATSAVPQDEIGSSSPGGSSDAAMLVSPSLALPPASPHEIEDVPHITQPIEVQDEIRLATGPRFAETLVIKGAAGAGATGTSGAVDRITQEILLSLEERRTLVVWFFDQSGSLERQRGEIVKRFERIYEELGVIEAAGNPAFKKYEDKPLLTSIVAFGENVSFLIPKPTDDIAAITSAVSSLKTDSSGIERTFHAVHQAATRFRQFRTQEPRRNVLFVIFTDEAGDDEAELDSAVAICRRHAIPVYCVGVPAPFGRRDANIKYVDPDPKYDQSVQWIGVRQGPESYLPELVKIGSIDSEEPMDSGFGPYSLTRLCYETGGVFFAVHPNRDARREVSRRDTAVLSAQLSFFFDPQIMLNYRPDYVSIKEYRKLLTENKARRALVEAAEMSWLTPMERPQLLFPKVNDASLATLLSQAQHAAAVLEPQIARIYQVLKEGEVDRPRLTKPRWQAGYDLSMGRVLALKVRTEGYNSILAKAKQGMRFEDPKNDTWRLVPSEEVSVSSTLEAQAKAGKQYLERVVNEHPGTPWALLAKIELQQPFGWKWQEMYTGVNAPRQAAAGNAGPPQDDKAQKIPRPQRRAPPKL
jgi:Mg-chelatase subunit ChlD